MATEKAPSKKKQRRSKGTGYLYTRGKIYWWQPPTIDGITSKPFSLETSDKTKAEEKIQEYLPNRKLKKKTDVIIELAEAKQLYTDNRIQIKEAFQKYIKHKKRRFCSISTLNQKKSYWNEFTLWLPAGLKYIEEITETHAEKYLEHLEEIKSPRVHNEQLKYLKNIFNILKDRKDNPFFGYQSIEEINVKKKPFTADILQRIFFAFDDELYKNLPLTEDEKKYTNEKPYLRVQNKEEQEILHHLGPWTGQRLKDCVLSEWKYIDLHKKRIRVLPYKTISKKPQRFSIPMHPDLYESLLIAYQWKQPGNDHVLPGLAKRYSGKGTYPGVNKDCIKILKYIGLDTSIAVEGRNRKVNIYGFHSFRHAFAFFLLDANESYEIIEALLGSGAEIIREHYSSFGMKKLEDAINALPRKARLKAISQDDLVINVSDQLQTTRNEIIKEINCIDDLARLKSILKDIRQPLKLPNV